MMRIFVLAFATALLGCVGTYDRMDAWLGLSKQSVLDSFDRHPDTAGQDVLGKWIQWRRHDESTCSDRFSFKNNRVVAYSSDCGTWGGLSAPIAPRQKGQ